MPHAASAPNRSAARRIPRGIRTSTVTTAPLFAGISLTPHPYPLSGMDYAYPVCRPTHTPHTRIPIPNPGGPMPMQEGHGPSGWWRPESPDTLCQLSGDVPGATPTHLRAGLAAVARVAERLQVAACVAPAAPSRDDVVDVRRCNQPARGPALPAERVRSEHRQPEPAPASAVALLRAAAPLLVVADIARPARGRRVLGTAPGQRQRRTSRGGARSGETVRHRYRHTGKHPAPAGLRARCAR
jgi:hypothetical protein